MTEWPSSNCSSLPGLHWASIAACGPPTAGAISAMVEAAMCKGALLRVCVDVLCPCRRRSWAGSTGLTTQANEEGATSSWRATNFMHGRLWCDVNARKCR